MVAQLSGRPAEQVSDQLRLAALAVESDQPQTAADIGAATQQALRLGDLPLAERLGRAALDRSGGLTARLALAYALAWQGRGRQAGELLAAVDPVSLSDKELMAWALPRAANQFWMLGEPERATAFLHTTRNRVASLAGRATLDALAATFAMNAGTPLRALRARHGGAGRPTCRRGGGRLGRLDGGAVLGAQSAGSTRSTPLAARAVAGEHPGLLRFTSGFARVTALLMRGQLRAARALAQRYTDFAELQQPGRAIGEVLVAYVAIAQGDFEAAVALLEPAADALGRTGYSWGPLSLMLLAQALGQQGEQVAAAKVCRRAESMHGLKSALFAPELALARAWSRAAGGDTPGAIEAARERGAGGRTRRAGGDCVARAAGRGPSR